MTLLARKVTYYLRCDTGHRFERGKPDGLRWCPKCGMPVKLYGLADSTRYTEDPGDKEMEGLPGEELPDAGS